jgi:hypothetical protein
LEVAKICPKSKHTRNDVDNATTPDWQCPSCGTAYMKVIDAARGCLPDAQAIREARTARQPVATMKLDLP